MRVDAEKLKAFGRAVAQKAGLGEQDAEVFVDSLVEADLRGIGSHGVSRLKVYAQRLESGVVDASASPRILLDSPGALEVDGCNMMGAPLALRVMEMCIQRARENGSCFAAVKNANHFGAGAYFTEYAARRGMLAFAVANGEVGVIPTGGAKAMLGTNPLSVALPGGSLFPPVVLDMATSMVARGKVVLAQKNGKKIPLGWAVDKNGAPTTEPGEVLDGGSMMPFGGAKGYGISLIIDILCACVAGACNCRTTPSFWSDFEHPQNVGFFMGCIDLSRFVGAEDYDRAITAELQEFKDCPTAPGVESVMLPGEIEHNTRLRNLQQGVELGDGVLQELRELAEKYGIPFLA